MNIHELALSYAEKSCNDDGADSVEEIVIHLSDFGEQIASLARKEERERCLSIISGETVFIQQDYHIVPGDERYDQLKILNRVAARIATTTPPLTDFLPPLPR